MDELIRQVGRLGRKLGWFGLGMALYIGYSEYERYKTEQEVAKLKERIRQLEEGV